MSKITTNNKKIVQGGEVIFDLEKEGWERGENFLIKIENDKEVEITKFHYDVKKEIYRYSTKSLKAGRYKAKMRVVDGTGDTGNGGWSTSEEFEVYEAYRITLTADLMTIMEGQKITFTLKIEPSLPPAEIWQNNYLIKIEGHTDSPEQVLHYIQFACDNSAYQFSTEVLGAGAYEAVANLVPAGTDAETFGDLSNWSNPVKFRVESRRKTVDVNLQRTSAGPSNDQALWVAIRNRTNAINFSTYKNFLDLLFACKDNTQFPLKNIFPGVEQMAADIATTRGLQSQDFRLNVHGPNAYAVLKLATQVFLTLEAGVIIRDGQWYDPRFDASQEAPRLGQEEAVTISELKAMLTTYLNSSGCNEVLPYLNRIVKALWTTQAGDPTEVLPYCYGVLQSRFSHPSLIELIWSYWHEEGMLAQTMNAIAMRFQNQRSGHYDPLAELEIDPLRPLNNLIWGFIQDEHNRLTVRRRAYEYDHQYGLKLVGRAIPELRSADSRSKFIEAFHNLLYRTAVFYREDADTTVHADAFPLLNALKDVHLLLAEGAHNQYGDLPWTARAEMLTQQWLLARPEMREFLRGRHMVPYQEPWMGAVDAMKKLQGWTDTTITHFNELAVDGERLLLSIRFGDWNDLNITEQQALNWARYWKPEIQRYLYGYLAVTGVDLMADITDSREAAARYLQPSMLLQRRLAAQIRQPRLPGQRVRMAS